MVKKDPIVIELKKINKKIDILKESSDLGSFDNSILTIMVFIITLSLSLLSLNFIETLKTIPPLLVTFVYFAIISAFVVFLFQLYLQSMFIKKMNFTIKCFCLSFLQSLGTFLVLLIIVSFTMWWGYEKHTGKFVPNSWVTNSMIVMLLISIIYGIYSFYKNQEYFKKNFKNIYKQKEK